MNMQYLEYQAKSGGVWHDSIPVINPPSGDFTLNWDNSGLGEFDAVRIKAIDMSGLEHYSNKVLVSPGFWVDTCTFTGRNSLYEDLTLLRLQVLSGQDSRYVEWTDYKVYDASKGNTIPVGDFSIAPPEGTIKPGMS